MQTSVPVGAEGAWCLTVLRIELSELVQEPTTGGCTDIYKCFDQIVMMLLYVLLDASLPTRALTNAACSLTPSLEELALPIPSPVASHKDAPSA